MKNFAADLPEARSTSPVSEKGLWYMVFSFTRDLQGKAERANQKGQDGGLYGNFFVRQGPLSVESDSILKTTTGKYFEEVDPLDQRAKTIIEALRAKKSAAQESLPLRADLKEVQSQKDNITLKYREYFRSSISEEIFAGFSEFLAKDLLKNAFGGSSSVSRPEGEGFCFLDYYGFPETLFDDRPTPPLISGYSILFYFYDDCGPIYDPSLDSFFGDLTTNTLFDDGSDTGYRDLIPALYDHPIFFSIRGHEYCTIEDGYLDLYDGPMLIDEIPLGEAADCHIVGPAPTPTPTPSPTPTPNVVSVTFSQVNPSSELISQNPAVAPYNPGIGQRIFADHDTPQDTNDRQLVRVTATLSQPVANVPVYFRNFDLDDPTTDTTIDTNGTAGDDNNGSAGDDSNGMPTHAGRLLQANGCGADGASTFCPTDASGVATIVFRVTRQPGDNFAIAAGLAPAQVNAVNANGIELTDGVGQTIPTENCPTQAICRSQMLTVWRRLHIEVDSMGASIQNRAIGTITTTTRIRTGQTVTVPLNPTSPATLEPNRFEGGRFFANSRSFSIPCNIAMGDTCNTATSVTVRNTGPLVTLFADTPFELYDDDDFNDNDGTNVDGDTLPSPGEDIPEPDTSLLQPNSLICSSTVTAGCNVFATSYVVPKYDLGPSDTNDDSIFAANVDSSTTTIVRSYFVDFDQISFQDDSNFWTIYLYGAYQMDEDEDGDPDDQNGDGVPHGCGDISYGVTDTFGPNGWGSMVFMEAGRPHEYASDYLTRPVSRAWTAAHEVGHLFGGDHDDFGIMAATCERTGYEFAPLTIRRLRHEIMHP